MKLEISAAAQARGRAAEERPGRTCPVSYRYSPKVFDRDPEIVAGTIYAVGGLYGNIEALEAVQAMAAREREPVKIGRAHV